MTEQKSKITQIPEADLQDRTEIMTILQEYVSSLSGTQASKAKALGITQPRLNDLLKNRIEKFSLNALLVLATKAGHRVGVNIQKTTRSYGGGTIDPSRNISSSVFAPHPSELSKLDSRQATELFHALLRCSALSAGLGPKDVILSHNINVSDNGIDAKVEGSTVKSGLLQNGSSYFQIKSGVSFKPWQLSDLIEELFGKGRKPLKKNLKTEVGHCFDQNGTYVLVTFGHDLLPANHTKAVELLTKLIVGCGYVNPKIIVIGQGQIVGEIDRYPSICLHLIGLDEGGFQSIAAWRTNAQMRLPLELGDQQNKLIDDIRKTLQDNATQHIRIIGEPGIGKTRLILEALSIDEIAPSVIYVPTGEDFQKSRLYNELIKPDRHYYATLVIDDCDNDDRSSIWGTLKGLNRLKLITIDHGPESSFDSTMKVFSCPPLQESQIKIILANYLDSKIDLTNWADWCSGSPRVAHAVGENLKSNPGDIFKPPADVPIWDRFIVGHKSINSQEAEQYRIVLTHIALFTKFGFESPVNAEAQFICDRVREVDPSITWGKFQTIVQHFRNKRILQGRHTLFIVPKLLHIYLWREYWDRYGRGFSFKCFFDNVPVGLQRWFLEMFIYAHEEGPVNDVVKKILSIDGPYSDNKFVESEAGLKLLRYLAEANPNATLAVIERTVKTWPHEKLLSWNAGRQDIVWAMEKIAAWDDLFSRAVEVLVPMALAENARYSNNSKGLLLDLFSVGEGWAPTQTPPLKKFPILQTLVKSRDTAVRTLAFEMCKKWLSTYGGSRAFGLEYQGIKPAIKFWRPKTYGEIFEPWRQVLNLLANELKRFDIHDRNTAVQVLIEAARGLIRYKVLADEVMDIVLDLASDDEINKKLLTDFVIWELHQEDEKLDRQVLDKIRKLDRLLTGETLWDRIVRYVLNTSFDEDYIFRKKDFHESQIPAKRVKALAKEATKNSTTFLELAQKLLCQKGHRLPNFGQECGRLVTRVTAQKFFDLLHKNHQEINSNFLGGFLTGIREVDPENWELQLNGLLKLSGARNVAIECVWRSGYTIAILSKLIEMRTRDEISSHAFDQLVYRDDIKEIPDELFNSMIMTILNHTDESSVSTCTHLIYYYYFKDKTEPEFPRDLVVNVLSATSVNENHDLMYGYHWNKVAATFLERYPDTSVELLTSILDRITKLSRYDDTNYLLKIADHIVKEHPQASWHLVSERILATEPSRYAIIDWLQGDRFEDRSEAGAIRHMPVKSIIDWIKINVDTRLWIIQQVLPKTLDPDQGGKLTSIFIEEFGSSDDVSINIMVHFHVGSWSGPESDYLSRKREKARSWLSQTTSPSLQSWLTKYIDYLNGRIEDAKIQEERRF